MSAEFQQAQFRFIPARHLALSPLNVRQSGGEIGIEQLAELIAAEGVLQNLNVYDAPNADQATTHAVVAGGRRWRALRWLIGRGRIEPDYPVPCMVISRERAVQISLSENSGREPMHPADEFEAFRQLIDAGQSVEDVAARFGVTPLVVQRRLKLANVSPRFIELYRDGKVTLEHLMAVAVTDDHERQHQAWESLKSYERDPEALRDLLTQDDMSMKDPIARFVGIKAYQKAGGVIRRDLFAGDNDALLDVTLVRRLATEKLAKHAAKLRAEGIAWVETHLTFDYAARAAYGQVRATLRARNAEEQGQLDALRAQREEIQASIGAAEGETEEYDALLAQLEDVEDRIDALDDQRTVPDPEQQAVAGAVVSIARDGKVCVERDLLKAEDAERFARARKSSEPTTASEAPRLHSAALTRRLTAQRTLALQAELVQQPMTAVIALTHRMVLATFYAGAIAGESAVRIDVGSTLLAQHTAELESTAAQETLTAHRQRHVEALPSDPEELLPWLTAQSGGDLMALLAYCVAITVDGVRSSEEPCALDALAAAAKLDMRRWWRPTAENYFGSIPKARILAAITEASSAADAGALAKLKKAALAEAAERQLANKNWLPTLMRSAE